MTLDFLYLITNNIRLAFGRYTSQKQATTMIGQQPQHHPHVVFNWWSYGCWWWFSMAVMASGIFKRTKNQRERKELPTNVKSKKE